MSYILDALKKQDQEREIGHIPTVETRQEIQWPRRDNRMLALWLTIILLLALLAFMIGFLWSRLEVPVQTASTEVAVSSRDEGALESSSAVKPVKQFVPPNHSISQQARAVKDTIAAEPLPTLEKPVKVAAPVSSEPTAPLLENLPFADRQGLPPLSLDVHVYAEQAERRFVLLNLKKMREGDNLDNIYLEAITPAGVVLSHNGVRFRVQRQ